PYGVSEQRATICRMTAAPLVILGQFHECHPVLEQDVSHTDPPFLLRWLTTKGGPPLPCIARLVSGSWPDQPKECGLTRRKVVQHFQWELADQTNHLVI